MKIKDPNGKLARWAIGLQTYNFEIVHRPGKKHTNADALSRAFNVVDNEVDDTDNDRSIKELDPWEDECLLHYLKTGKFLPGSSKKQCKKVEKKKENYVWENDKLYARKGYEKLNLKLCQILKKDPH